MRIITYATNSQQYYTSLLEPYIKILNLKSDYKKSKLKENYYIF